MPPFDRSGPTMPAQDGPDGETAPTRLHRRAFIQVTAGAGAVGAAASGASAAATGRHPAGAHGSAPGAAEPSYAGLASISTVPGPDGLALSDATAGSCLVSNPGGHSIVRFGAAAAGKVFRLVFQAGTGVIIDNDRIRGPNATAYSWGGTSFPTQFITDPSLNILSPQRGDVVEVMSLGNVAADGGCAWQLLSFTPWKLQSFGSAHPDRGAGETNDLWGVGLRGWGANPWTTGILAQYQPGVSKVTLPSLVLTGPSDGGNKIYRNIAKADGSALGNFNSFGEMVPVNSAGDLGHSGTKDQWRFFANDPHGHPVITPSEVAPGVLADWGVPGSVAQGNTFEDWVIATEVPAATRRGGAKFWALTPNGQTIPIGRLLVSGASGNVIVPGKAAAESSGAFADFPNRLRTVPWGSMTAAQWAFPGRDIDPVTEKGWGNLSLIATDLDDPNCATDPKGQAGAVGGNAALAIRLAGSHGTGLDFGYKSGFMRMFAVSGGARTSLFHVDPRTNALRFDPLVDAVYSGAGAAPQNLTVRNDADAGGTTAMLNLNPSADPDNGLCQLRSVNDGGRNISLSVYLSQDGTPTQQFTVKADGRIQAPHYGAGAASFDSSGNLVGASDEALKIKVGTLADHLLAGAEGEGPAVTTLRAVGRPQTWRWIHEQAEIEAARAAMPTALAAHRAHPQEVEGFEAQAAATSRALHQAHAQASAELERHWEVVRPLAEHISRGRELLHRRDEAHNTHQTATHHLAWLRREQGKGADCSAAIATHEAKVRADATALHLRQAALDAHRPLPETASAHFEKHHALLAAHMEAALAIERHETETQTRRRQLRRHGAHLESEVARLSRLARLADAPDQTLYVGSTAQQFAGKLDVAVFQRPDGRLNHDLRAELGLHTEVLHELADLVKQQGAELQRLRAELAALRRA